VTARANGRGSRSYGRTTREIDVTGRPPGQQVKVPPDARSIRWWDEAGVEHVKECKTHREVLAALVELGFEVAYRAPAWRRRQVRKRRRQR